MLIDVMFSKPVTSVERHQLKYQQTKAALDTILSQFLPAHA
jgi:hypothetical protein